MSITFSHPEYLLLLLPAWAYTWWVAATSLADLERARRRMALWMRLVVLTLLVGALAGARLVRPSDGFCTIFVVDVSDSMAPSSRAEILNYIHQATKRMASSDSAAVVAFGAEALLDHAAEDRGAIGSIVSLPTTSRTNIAAGIQLAMASFPQEMGKQIVIFSDGNENVGHALDQAALAHSGNVHISVVPIARDMAAGEALILSVNAPGEVHQGAPIPVTVLAESLRETDGAITLYQNNTPLETRKIHLPAGKTAVQFETSVAQSDMAHFHAILDVPAAYDNIPDNKVGDAYTHVTGKPTVCLIEGAPADGAYLARALRANDLQVMEGGPDRLPKSIAECGQYDSLLLANVPAWAMSPTQQSILQSAVHDTGMGLVMIGGEESFGAGGYLHTPVEEALPVSMEPKQLQAIPSQTLVIVIDISGSMSLDEDGVQKVQLAANAAGAAVEMLQPSDNICVIGFDTGPVYAVPMRKADDKDGIRAQVARLRAGGGGIDTAPALEEAYRAIHNADTRIKHVIICPDAQDTEVKEGCLDIANRMRQEHITLSVIGFGKPTDCDVPFQRQLAEAGGGKSYLAERLSNLPQIFTSDVMGMSKPLFMEKPFRVALTDTAHPLVSNIDWASAPPLLGQVVTAMKDAPGARELLASPKQDPVLAAWSYGLGRSLAFTSDATNHWGAPWLAWPAFSTFWAQSVRWTLRNTAPADFRSIVTEEQGQGNVVVEAVTPSGEYRNQLDLRAHIARVNSGSLDGPKVLSTTVPLTQTASGRYETSFDAHQTGAYQVTVEEHQGDTVTGLRSSTLVIPYSPEFQTLRPNQSLLASLAARANGVLSPAAGDIFSKLRFSARVPRDTWALLVVLLALLFLADVAVRRVLLPWSECWQLALAGVRRVWPRLPHRLATAPTTPTYVNPLLEVKEKARAKQQQSSNPLPTAPPEATVAMQAELPPRAMPSDTAPPPDGTPATTKKVDTPPPATTTGTLLQRKREREREGGGKKQ